jgi:mannose-6-phosphate isomerase-like protein (cupin superfamily)
MSGYTIINLKQLEDSVSERNRGIEGRFGRKHLESDHLGVSHFRYQPGVRGGNGHTHREQEEVYVVLGGSGRIRLGDEIHDLREWDVVRVSPHTIRSIQAGDEGIEFLAVGSDRPEGGDGMSSDSPWPED